MKSARRFSLFGLALLLAFASSSAAQERRVARPQYGGFDLEVHVDGGPLEVIYGRGRRYVEAREGAEYELVVRNPLPVRVAVALSVDGLNTVDARHTSAWEASKWVIEPYGSIRVSGWQMSSTRARRFYFTTERDSYAARLGRASDLGIITAVFFRESTPRPYPVTPPPPYPRPYEESPRPRSENALAEREMRAESQRRAGEGASKSRGSAGVVTPRDDDEYAATGIGRSVYHDVEWIQMPLERGPAAEISVRYEFRDALVRLGLLPRPWRDDGALRRRERARGFDGPYSPEP